MWNFKVFRSVVRYPSNNGQESERVQKSKKLIERIRK